MVRVPVGRPMTVAVVVDLMGPIVTVVKDETRDVVLLGRGGGVGTMVVDGLPGAEVGTGRRVVKRVSELVGRGGMAGTDELGGWMTVSGTDGVALVDVGRTGGGGGGLATVGGADDAGGGGGLASVGAEGAGGGGLAGLEAVGFTGEATDALVEVELRIVVCDAMTVVVLEAVALDEWVADTVGVALADELELVAALEDELALELELDAALEDDAAEDVVGAGIEWSWLWLMAAEDEDD